MYFDHNLFQENKLSEDQKKGSSPKLEGFSSPNLSEDQRSDADQSQIIGGGGADADHTQFVGGDTVKLSGDISPDPPGFRHPWVSGSVLNFGVLV